MSSSTINGGATGIGAGALAGFGTIATLNGLSGRVPSAVGIKYGVMGGVVLGGLIGLGLEGAAPQHRGARSSTDWATERAVRGALITGGAATVAAGFLALTLGRGNGMTALEGAKLIGHAAAPAALFGAAAGAGISTLIS